MKVSIITVCYNSGKTIEQTILSVLQQSYSDIEYIIVDGKSTDNTLDIIKKYESEISIIVSEKDCGIYDAMNKGVALANGEIIGILNSDDVYFNYKTIQNIVDAFSKNKVECIYGNILFFKENINNIVRVWRTKAISKYYFELGNIPPHPSLFVYKSVYNTVGNYNIDFKISADHEFLIRALKIHNIKACCMNEFIVRMRIGGISTSGFKSFVQSTREIKKAWNLNGLQYPFWLYAIRPLRKTLELIQGKLY